MEDAEDKNGIKFINYSFILSNLSDPPHVWGKGTGDRGFLLPLPHVRGKGLRENYFFSGTAKNMRPVSLLMNFVTDTVIVRSIKFLPPSTTTIVPSSR